LVYLVYLVFAWLRDNLISDPRPLGAGGHGGVDRAFPLLATRGIRARRNVRADSAHAEPARRRQLPRLVKSAARTRLPALPFGVVSGRRPLAPVPVVHAHSEKKKTAGEKKRTALLFFLSVVFFLFFFCFLLFFFFLV
jgi:hypothetical protein